VSAWNAIFAPKGTPEPAVAKLSDALVRALDDEGTRKKLLALGGVIPEGEGRKPAALQSLVESEVARWTPVLKGAAATAQ
jgi:tripartite-type tricarboxylate transporter receptor subunit TctC